MLHLKLAFAVLAVAVAAVQAKPSHPFDFHAIPDHFDFAPPVLPPTHFHAAPALIPAPAPAPFLPAPAHLYPAPAPVLPAPTAVWHTHVIPAAAPVFPAPAPLLPAPAPVIPAAAPFVPAALPITRVLPPVFEAIPFAAPTYRAIPGPKTTTHHVSIGYAFPPPAFAKFVGPHAHLHSAPLAFPHHHHSLF